MTAPVAVERITDTCGDSGWITLNDYKYLLVCTDGSALHSSDCLSARAGWSVWYSEQSPFNGYEVLVGMVQTSFKVEARALLHVVRTAGVPICFVRLPISR